MNDKPKEIKGLEVGKEFDLLGKKVKVVESCDHWLMCHEYVSGGLGGQVSHGERRVKLGWWHDGKFEMTTLTRKEVDLLC